MDLLYACNFVVMAKSNAESVLYEKHSGFIGAPIKLDAVKSKEKEVTTPRTMMW